MGILEGQLDATVQTKLNQGAAAPGAVETVTASRNITAADNGKILWIPNGNPQVDLTFDAGLAEGFEVTVAADSDAPVTVSPAAGQQIADGTQPPNFLAVDTPVVSPAVNGQSGQLATGWWKLVGTKWVNRGGVTGWLAEAVPVFQFDIAGVGVVLDNQQFDLAEADTFMDFQVQPADPADFNGRDVVIDGETIVDNGTLAVAIPHATQTTDVQVTGVDIGGGSLVLSPGSVGGLSSVQVSVGGGGQSLINVPMNVVPPPVVTQLQVANLDAAAGIQGAAQFALGGGGSQSTAFVFRAVVEATAQVLGEEDESGSYTDGVAVQLQGVYLEVENQDLGNDLQMGPELGGGETITMQPGSASEWNYTGNPPSGSFSILSQHTVGMGNTDTFWLDTEGRWYVRSVAGGQITDFATAVGIGAI